MNDNREMIEDQLDRYEAQLRSLNSFIKELNDRAAECGTDREHFKGALMEAENNVKYYEGEITRIKELMGQWSESATYWIYKDTSGEWRWQLRVANKNIIADSGEGYRNKEDCSHAIALVKDSKYAPVKEKQ